MDQTSPRLIDRLIVAGWTMTDSRDIARFVVKQIYLPLTAYQDSNEDFVTVSWIEGKNPGERKLADCWSVDGVNELISILIKQYGSQ